MAASSEAENFASAKTISAMMRSLNELPKPTIARVNGAAYAAGVGLVSACDIAVAVEDAVFSISEVRIGLVPSTISPYVLAAIGARAARRYFLTGEPFPAADACRLGLVHKVVARAGLDDAVEDVISALLAGGPHSRWRAKQLIAEVAGRPVDDALEALTARSIAEARASPEGREGIEAFLHKRRPAWWHE
jgi:methylglutaconyl-CoA hydratase